MKLSRSLNNLAWDRSVNRFWAENKFVITFLRKLQVNLYLRSSVLFTLFSEFVNLVSSLICTNKLPRVVKNSVLSHESFYEWIPLVTLLSKQTSASDFSRDFKVSSLENARLNFTIIIYSNFGTFCWVNRLSCWISCGDLSFNWSILRFISQSVASCHKLS